MAIFVSNQPSAAVPTFSSDALDPSALAPEEGFTEELAAAMQPSAVLADASAKMLLDNLEDSSKKASDLQILPAEVLVNAVGDANFAFIGQAGVANSTAQNSGSGTALTDVTETLEQDTTGLDLANQLQGAELAAANLAAQMSATAAHVAVSAAANPGEVSAEVSAALAISAMSGTGQEAGQALQAPASGSNLQQGEQVASAAHLASAQTLQAPASGSNLQQGEQVASAAHLASAQSSPSSGTESISSATVSTGSQAAMASVATVSSDTKAEAQASQAQESAFNFDAKLAKLDALQNTKVLETAVSLSGVAKSNAQLEQASLTLNGKALGVQAGATTSALTGAQISTQAAATATSEIDSEATTFSNVQSGIRTERKGESFPASSSSPIASTAAANRMDSAALAVANPNSAVMAQEAPQAEATQSLEDISSSFVSSLVGGPQRPVTTVMNWISMQSQERPAPLVPHEVRLDAGAVQMEIQKMVKQGGGHVVMELTPPDQSKFTIELKLDERGNALLIVEGVSDSTKTRLEQSAPQLREQFQQMGLELQLDMRQQGQSASSNAANFADAQERGSGDNNLANNGAGDTPKILTPREAGANRARETGSNQVYLYA